MKMDRNKKSPSGLSDSLDKDPHMRSLDSKKLSSEYDSAELSRNFNYEESEETLKNKLKSDRSKKSADGDTEYEDDFEASSHVFESSSFGKNKKNLEKIDEIEDIRKRQEEIKSKMENYHQRESLSSSKDPVEESRHLDSYRDKIKDTSKEPSERSSSMKHSSVDEARYRDLMYREEKQAKSLEFANEDLTKEKYEAEFDAKRHEMEAKMRREEALNANESVKRMKEQLMQYVQDNNVYRVEIEGLKRQIDIADSNSQAKDEELKAMKNEFEEKLKTQAQKLAGSNVRQEARELNELRRELRLTKEAHEQENQEKFEEIDYLTKRCEKLESENVSLRVGNKAVRDSEAKAKKYEEETHALRMKLKEHQQSKETKPVLDSNYNHWTKEQLVRELNSIDRAIERFSKENESLMHENGKLKKEIEELNSLLYKESQKIQDYKHKLIKETGSVIVIEEDKDLHVKAFNDLGIEHSISQKDFNELKEKLFNAEKQIMQNEQDYTVKEVNYKKEIDIVRKDKLEAEKRMINLDSTIKTLKAENEQLKEIYSEALDKAKRENTEVSQKLEWYMENQDMIDKDSEIIQQKDKRIAELKEEINGIKLKDGGRKRMAQLEKQVKDLQDALAKKNPNSLPLLLQAVKPSFDEQEETRKLKETINKLQKELERKEDEFDKKVRSMRIEQDKMKTKYDKTKPAPVPADVKDRRIEDLERQVMDTKDYYIKKLKKMQDEKAITDVESKVVKSKLGSTMSRKSQIKDEMNLLNEIEQLRNENDKNKKMKKKLERDIKSLKEDIRDKPVDLVSAIHALINEDYVFCLCGLYKDTLLAKKALEKGTKYDDALRLVEELVDSFDKASEKFKSNKALSLFNKITEKCIELSQIVQENEENKTQDKAKPHAKLTSIEHLLKDEIERSIGKKLTKNEDMQIVETSEGFASSPKKPKKSVKVEDDDYWSDFSDDIFTQEVNEESKAEEVLFSLQRWVYTSNLEENLKNKYPDRNVISLDEFKETLIESEYYTEFIDLQSLLKRLNIQGEEGIDYLQFLEDINEKNAAWWKETLKSNSFELNNRGKRKGNYRQLCNKAVYNFIFNNLGEKTKESINRAGFMNHNEFVDEIFEDHEDGITKRDLRKQFIEKEVPLTRLDTHILYKTLENKHLDKVESHDLKAYIENPQQYQAAKGGDVYSGWIDEEVGVSQKHPGLGASGVNDQYDELLEQLQKHIKKNSVDVKTLLTQSDTRHDGKINIKDFKNFNKSIKSPLTSIEQKILFNALRKEFGGEVTIEDLVSKLKPKSALKEKEKVKPSPSKPGDSKDKAKIKELENNIKQKNRTIIDMEKEIRELKLELSSKPDSSSNTDGKAKRLEKEKEELNRRLKETEDKFGKDKKKFEEILKESIMTPQNGDFLLLQKKIEFLERDLLEKQEESKREMLKNSYSSKDRQEIKQLKSQIEYERDYYSKLIEKKNSEIALFRDELDVLLQELDELKKANYEKELMFMQQQNRDIPSQSQYH